MIDIFLASIIRFIFYVILSLFLIFNWIIRYIGYPILIFPYLVLACINVGPKETYIKYKEETSWFHFKYKNAIEKMKKIRSERYVPNTGR